MRTGPIEDYKAVLDEFLATGFTPRQLKQMIAEKTHDLVCKGKDLRDDPEIRKLWAVREILLELYPELKED